MTELFFLCAIKLYKIGDSEPAVKFEVVEKPNDWTKEIKKSTNANPTQQFRCEYWLAFNEYGLSTLFHTTFIRSFLLGDILLGSYNSENYEYVYCYTITHNFSIPFLSLLNF